MQTDILFLFPAFSGGTFYHLNFNWHLGASYILAYLKEKGIKACQFIQKEPIDMHNLIKRILAYSPKIVGFTCYDINYYFVKLIAKELKKVRKEILIVTGGPTATFSDTLILNDAKAIDICVRGEGEEAATQITGYIKGRIDISQICGVSYRYKDEIIRNPDRPLLRGEKGKELDIFPSPYLTSVLPSEGNIGILTSRGCIYHCTYCNFSAMSRWQVSYHSIERVIDELKIISGSHNENHPRSGLIYFYDDTFSLNMLRAKKICKRIIEEKISLPFWCQTRADRIDKDLLELMKKANFRLIHFGLESAVPRNLRTIKKVAWRTERDKSLAAEKKFIHKIKSNTKKIQALGLDVSVSIIIGLPKQSKKQAEVTVDFVKNLKPAFYFHDYLTLYPGTPLFNARKKFGLDIISPKTVLPYKTKFTFDVTEVAMLPSAVQRNDILNSLTETAINFFIRKNSFLGDTIGVSVIFIKDSKLNIGDFIKKDKITLSPILFFLQDDGRNIKKYLYNLIQKEFPIINLLSLQRIVPDKKILINDTRVYGLIFITEIIERRRVDFQKLALFIFLPLSQLYRKEETIALNLGNENGERKVIFLTLNNHEDKINFEKLLIDTRPLKDLLRRNQAECYLVNQCQWSNRLCPLAEEKILFIDKKGKSSSCFNGKEIINMRFPISNYFKEIEKRRRCKSCPVNNVCAKCLFVFPFSEEEFCRIRRNGSTGKLLGMLEKCNNVLHTAEYLSRLDNN